MLVKLADNIRLPPPLYLFFCNGPILIRKFIVDSIFRDLFAIFFFFTSIVVIIILYFCTFTPLIIPSAHSTYYSSIYNDAYPHTISEEITYNEDLGRALGSCKNIRQMTLMNESGEIIVPNESSVEVTCLSVCTSRTDNDKFWCAEMESGNVFYPERILM